MDHGPGKLRGKYDPRDLSGVFVELLTGDHVRLPFANLSRQPIALWEYREASQRLRWGASRPAQSLAAEEEEMCKNRIIVDMLS